MEKSAQKKVLIVEDEKTLSKALELKLKSAGYDVTAVYNGEDAQHALVKDKYSFLLLDLIMPKINGFDVLQFMKTKKIKIPTVVLSNLSQEEDMKKVLELGALKYLVKSNTSLNTIVDLVKQNI